MSQEDESKVLDELFGASDGGIEHVTSQENSEKINFDQEEEEIEEKESKKKSKKKTEESNEDSTEVDGI